MLTIKNDTKMHHQQRIIELWAGIVAGVFGGGIKFMQMPFSIDYFEKLMQAGLTALITGGMGAAGAKLFGYCWKHFKNTPTNGKDNQEKKSNGKAA